MNEDKIIVNIIKSRQPKPCADSEYEYEYEIIAENCSEYMIKDFCTRLLLPCSRTREQWSADDANSYFRGYYEFSKIADNKYRYYVMRPFAD